LRKGEIDAAEFGRVRDAALEIQDAPLYIDATGGISMAKLAARAASSASAAWTWSWSTTSSFWAGRRDAHRKAACRRSPRSPRV
jgi:hypothetical protein